MRWNDAIFNGIIIKDLPKDNTVFGGIGAGRIQGYNLPFSTLYFYTNFDNMGVDFVTSSFCWS